MAKNPVAAYTLTLTSADTNYQIAALIAAINSDERKNFSTIEFHAVGGIDGAGANTNDVLIGDQALATTRYFVALAPGDTMRLNSGSGANDVSTLSYYVRSAGAGQKINVHLISV